MTSKLLTRLFLLALTQLWTINNALADDWIYHAKEGDTLWDLCLQYTNKRGCWIELQRYNNISDDRAIPLGTEVRIPTKWMRFPPIVGTVLSVYGEVFYQISKTSENKALVQGQTVHLGAIISTNNGSARISLYPYSEVLLSPESRLELKNLTNPLDKYRSLELYMEKGEIEATIEPNSGTSFQIETPAAIAAVRGTRYRITIMDDNSHSTHTEVFSGSVEVLNHGSKLVSSGYGISSSPEGDSGEPIALLPPPTLTKNHMNLPLPVILEWARTGEESAWQLELFGAEDESAIIDLSKTTEPHFEYSNLPVGCYKVILQAIDKEGFHGVERQTSICVVPDLIAVADIGINKNTSDDNSWTARWTQVDNAVRYIIQLASDSSFQEIFETQVVSELKARIQPPSTDFSIRVIAQDIHGNLAPASEPVEYHNGDPLAPIAFLIYAAYLIVL